MKWTLAAALWILMGGGRVFATHPLITDDAATQGVGRFQIEINNQFDRDRAGGTTEDCSELSTVLAYGISEGVDVLVSVPFAVVRTRDASGVSEVQGFSDVGLELKWRFARAADWDFAVRPGITFPSGDRTAGLTAERSSQSLFVIGSRAFGRAGVHANAGYTRNDNIVGERTNLWHASIAGEWSAAKSIRAVANVGIERSPNFTAASDAVFALAGFVYSPFERLDLDIGYKRALTDSETDHAVLVGTAVRF